MAVLTLIARARTLGYSDAELSRRIGVTPSYLCDVAAGRKKMSPEAAALLADLCGEDASDALKRQTVENERRPERREALRKALFACWANGVGFALSCLAIHAHRWTVYTLWRIHKPWARPCGTGL